MRDSGYAVALAQAPPLRTTHRETETHDECRATQAPAPAAGLTVADLTERLRAAMNQSRKQRDQARTRLLSTILADLKNRELELNHPPSDDEAAEVLRRGIRRRREAAEQSVAGN